MYTAALVLSILLVLDRPAPENHSDLNSLANFIIGVWMIALLVGVIRFINGGIAELSGYGF